MNAKTTSAVLAALLTVVVPAGARLKEGDPAPPMKAMKWVKGVPVSRFALGRVYVVEFWATWCGPCRESIPHLTSLAKRYKGTVTFAGISVWESDRGARREATVTKFVRDMGARMGYSVGMDDDRGAMAKTWMAAAGQDGIPTAFVIGKNGRIAWIGHPMELDSVLPQVARASFNVGGAARKRAAYDAMVQQIGKAAQARDNRRAVAEMDRFLAAYPDGEAAIAGVKYSFLLQCNVPGAMAYAKRLTVGLFKRNAMALKDMAYTAIGAPHRLKARNYPILMTMAQRANTLTHGKNAMVLDTLAAVHASNGDNGKALATQQLAVSKMDKSMPAEGKKALMDHLAEYKAKN